MAEEAKRRGVDEIELTLSTMQEPVQRQLDQVLRPPPPTRVSWWPYFLGYGVVVLAPFAAMLQAYRRRKRRDGYRAREVGAALLFLSPWAIGFIVLLTPTLIARFANVASERMAALTFLLLAISLTVEFIAWTIGFGAAILTGLGRWYTVPPPITTAPASPNVPQPA